jgi:hypothetical protein
MTRLLALVSFVYQSASAIVLIFALSHILAPAEYTTFSLALASSQLLCVLMFEWLQLAGVRFLAAARGHDGARLRSSLVGAGLTSALALVCVGGLASQASTFTLRVVALGLGIAVLQGLTDLHFMMIRVSDRLGAAAGLMILRASLLLAGSIAGALLKGTTEAAMLGVVLGHAASLAIGWICYPTLLHRVPRDALLADWGDFSRYGMLAAGASVIHLSVPVAIRYIVISGLSAAGPAATAGFSMAIDLLQRPFAVLIAAIHTMNYPDVVVQFEHGTKEEARQATARFFDFILCATLVMLGGLIGFLPDAARLFVPPDIQTGFVEVAPAAAVFYFLHTQLQSTLAVIPHLTKAAVRLVVIAACQLVLASVLSAGVAIVNPSSAIVVAAASMATAVIIIFAAGPMIRFRAMPRWLLVFVAALAAAVIGASSHVPSEPMIWLFGKVAVSTLAVGLIAWQGNFLTPTRRAD